MTDEEFERFKERPVDFIYDQDREGLDLKIDDYEIDDMGFIVDVNWKEYA